MVRSLGGHDAPLATLLLAQAAPPVIEVTSLDQTVLANSHQGGNRGFGWPVEHDAVALDILGDWGVGGERSPGRARGGLRLRAGLTVREAIRFVATANPDLEEA